MRRAALVLTAISIAVGGVLLGTTPASAHVVPSTVIELDVHERTITADLSLPAGDLATASGIALPTSAGPVSPSVASRVANYLERHFHVRSGSQSWRVEVEDDAAVTPIEQWGTGVFPAVTVAATLTPPAVSQLRTFTLDYDAIVHQVVTADTYVVLRSDWEAGQLDSARTIGAIATNTVSGTVPPLGVNLSSGSAWQGFVGMLTLGIAHIAEGTDHQLFLLTLLLPAPLLAVGRRWSSVASTGRAARRITAITVAFTVGHSITLALGALGLPVPQQTVEAGIALSILVAAVHAGRPIFPGREPLIAGLFGLVHGMAFSTTLTALDLTGGQLVLSLLGFNLGIEVMQLAVVCIVLPPLIVLARTRAYPPLRWMAAALTAIAAVGWLLARVGIPNAVAVAADAIGPASPWLAAVLWAMAILVVVRGAARRGRRGAGMADTDRDAVPAEALAGSSTSPR